MKYSSLVIMLFLLVGVLVVASACKPGENGDDLTGNVVLNDEQKGQLQDVVDQGIVNPDDVPENLLNQLNETNDSNDDAGGDETPTAVCGNDKCEDDENCDSCDADCGCGTWEVCEDATCKKVACFEDRDCGTNDRCDSYQCYLAGTSKASCNYLNLCVTAGSSASSSSASASAVCGDGACETGETITNCPSDCRACNDGIDNDGDGLIDFGADPECAGANDNYEAPFCGNAWCDSTENEDSCHIDCWVPGPSDIASIPCSDGVDNDADGLTDYPNDPQCHSSMDSTEEPVCGDFLCEGHEHYGSCPDDCVASCGNGACEDLDGEDSTTCSADCNALSPICGDEFCDTAYESSTTCPFDCYCGNGACELGVEDGTPYCYLDPCAV